jgi:hypothetical protein
MTGQRSSTPKRRAAVAELVLDHPLRVRLGDDGPAILDAEAAADQLAVRGRGRRRDAIDDAARERPTGGDPLGHALIADAREHRVAGERAVVGEVVAGQDGERREPVAPPLRERLGEQCRGRRTVLGVAVGGDRQRHDPRARVGQRGDDRVALLGGEQVAPDDADDPGAVAAGAALDDRVQPVLRGERRAHLGPVQADADEAPRVRDAPLGERVEVHRLVRAVERADAHVHDRRGQRIAVIGRDGHAARMLGQRGGGQWDGGHGAPP